MISVNHATEVDLSGKRVLVTGGTGFIGGRLVETLVRDCAAKVRVLVRDFTHVPRISRFPIELVRGDVTSLEDVSRAVTGCELVFHCAYGNQGSAGLRRRATVLGTRNVVTAASLRSADRVVYVSTLAVYGHAPNGDLTESAPRKYTGEVYGDSKLDAEKVAFALADRYKVPLTVVQPTIVYGPFAPYWTANVINQLKTGRVILVDGGRGLCNAVYVDDVVQALLLAASRKEATGEAFLISAERPIAWREFFDAFEQMLGVSRTVSMSVDEAKTYSRVRMRSRSLLYQVAALLRKRVAAGGGIFQIPEISEFALLFRPAVPWMREFVRKLASDPNLANGSNRRRDDLPIHPLDAYATRLFESQVRVRIDKAKRLLGYRPAFDFRSGMEMTQEWARWANLLDSRGTREWSR